MLRAAAVGDSVMWGQGLALSEKFAFRYIKHLRDQGINIQLRKTDFKAHSGATIGYYAQLDVPTLVTKHTVNNIEHYDDFYGEIPSGYPTILKQLDELEQPETIDLLLINGGPNDIGITNSLSIQNSSFDALVIRMIPLLREQLQKLLKKASETAPGAKIVFTGYYPALSSESELPSWFLLQIPGLLFVSPILFALSVWTLKEIDDNKKQVERFHLYMLVEMARQIAEFNKENHTDILFCPSGFGIKNAMYAGNNYVFEFKENRDTEVDEARKVYCSVIDRRIEEERIEGHYEEVEEFSLTTCDEAYLAHPNPAGGRQYAEQLKVFADTGFTFSLKKQLENLGRGMRLRSAFRPFGFSDILRIRQLSDLQIISVITIQADLHITHATTATFFPEKLDVDFGWGMHEMEFHQIPAYSDYLGILDPKDNLPLNKLTKVRMYLGIREFMRFTMKVTLRVNGYQIFEQTINQDAFKKSAGRQFWEQKLQAV